MEHKSLSDGDATSIGRRDTLPHSDQFRSVTDELRIALAMTNYYESQEAVLADESQTDAEEGVRTIRAEFERSP